MKHIALSLVLLSLLPAAFCAEGKKAKGDNGAQKARVPRSQLAPAQAAMSREALAAGLRSHDRALHIK